MPENSSNSLAAGIHDHFRTTRFAIAKASSGSSVLCFIGLLSHFNFNLNFGLGLFGFFMTHIFFLSVYVSFRIKVVGVYLILIIFVKILSLGVVLPWHPVEGRVPAKVLQLRLLAVIGKLAILFLLRLKVFQPGRLRYVF